MTEPRSQENQQELFQEFSKEPKKSERLANLNRSQKPILISTTVEQLILYGILAILTGCFLFYLGMNRGKSFQAGAIRPAPASQLGQPALRAAPVTAAPPAARNIPLAPPGVSASGARNMVTAAELGKPYTIQLVTYKKRDLAEKEAAMLRRNGYYGAVIPSGDYYLVCVGQYHSISEAKKDLKLFSSKYKDCFLKRR